MGVSVQISVTIPTTQYGNVSLNLSWDDTGNMPERLTTAVEGTNQSLDMLKAIITEQASKLALADVTSLDAVLTIRENETLPQFSARLRKVSPAFNWLAVFSPDSAAEIATAFMGKKQSGENGVCAECGQPLSDVGGESVCTNYGACSMA